MKYHSYSPTLAKLHGKKTGWVDNLIKMRSEFTHTEIQFSERYGGISFSATMADSCRCARFKMIGYTHPERWLTTSLCVSDELEDAVWSKCCEMADLDPMFYELRRTMRRVIAKDELFFNTNALKYDLAQVSLGFISKWRIKRGNKTKVFCTESCFIALMEAWPELLDFWSTIPKDGLKRYRPDELTPLLGDMIIRNFARGMK
jgi:hypothetical protein